MARSLALAVTLATAVATAMATVMATACQRLPAALGIAVFLAMAIGRRRCHGKCHLQGRSHGLGRCRCRDIGHKFASHVQAMCIRICRPYLLGAKRVIHLYGSSDTNHNGE